MAENPVVTLGSLTASLVHEPTPDWGTPAREFGLVSGPLTRKPAQTLDHVSAQRQVQFTLKIVGVASLSESAADNKARQVHAWEIEVGKASNTLTYVGAERTTESLYRVVKNPPFPQPSDFLYEYGNEALIPIVLNVEPWVEGTPLTQVLATVQDTPGVVDFTVPGSVPTPLVLTATRGFSGSGLQTLVMARIPASFDLNDVLLLSKDAAAPNWDAYTASSGYTNASDNTLKCTDTEYRAQWWWALPVGRYKIYAKTRVQTGGRGWLAQSRAANDPSAAPVAVSDTDWRFVDLGDYASDGVTALRIVGKCREADNGILTDWILAVPLDYGSPFYFHCTALAVATVISRELITDLTLTTGGTRCARRYVSGPGLTAVGATRLLVAACDANGNLRRSPLSLSATLTPLYEHHVPTPEV